MACLSPTLKSIIVDNANIDVSVTRGKVHTAAGVVHYFCTTLLCVSLSSSLPTIIMRPSSLGGGRILRRTLSVRLSVPCLFTLEPSYERTSKIVKLPFSIIGQRQPCGRVVSFVLFTFAGRIL